MPWTEQDWKLLAQLRPGRPFKESIATLEGKLNAVWEGEVFDMVDEAGEEIFGGSVDEDGIVDSFVFHDERVRFGGIAPGMSFKKLKSMVTGLFRDCSDDAREMKADDDFDAYFAPHSPGLAWHFIREDDLVLTVALALSNGEVKRVDPFFEDLNFKLFVLESLLKNGTISLPEGEWVDDRDEDEDGDGEYSDAYVDRLLDRLDVCHEWPLKRQDLATIETLTFEDENQIHHYIHPLFDGESDEFNVMGIEGIEHLTNLKVLFIHSLAHNVSLQPLANHPTLQNVTLSCAIYKDFVALESVPNLKEVFGYFATDMYDEDTEVLKRLLAKGVNVKSLD